MSVFTIEPWQNKMCDKIREELDRLGCSVDSINPICVEPEVDELFIVYNEDMKVYVDGEKFLQFLKQLGGERSGGSWVWYSAGQSCK